MKAEDGCDTSVYSLTVRVDAMKREREVARQAEVDGKLKGKDEIKENSLEFEKLELESGGSETGSEDLETSDSEFSLETGSELEDVSGEDFEDVTEELSEAELDMEKIKRIGEEKLKEHER